MKRYIFIVLLLQPALLLQAGCSHQTPVEFPNHDAIPDGPGLFTGEDGAVKILSS